MQFDVMRESLLVCRPAAPSEDATASAAAGTDQAEGASTSEIMDMIEELVEEAGSSEDTVSLLLSLKLSLQRCAAWQASRSSEALLPIHLHTQL